MSCLVVVFVLSFLLFVLFCIYTVVCKRLKGPVGSDPYQTKRNMKPTEKEREGEGERGRGRKGMRGNWELPSGNW